MRILRRVVFAFVRRDGSIYTGTGGVLRHQQVSAADVCARIAEGGVGVTT